jgi:4'-phosphopantetheinyl transferase
MGLEHSGFVLTSDSIHVWVMSTRADPEVVSRFETLLTKEEISRAFRLRIQNAKDSFILTRGGLRLLLGRYICQTPTQIEIKYQAKGKPFVSSPAEVQFNVSHSGGLALYAFLTGTIVGVDVEHIRPISNAHDVASRFFNPQEVKELASLPEQNFASSFFTCWTRKEAFVKALGGGLSATLSDFCVTLLPGEPARIVSVGDGTASAEDWNLRDVNLGNEYAAAIAYCGKLREIEIRRIDTAELLQPSLWKSE